MSAPLHHTVMGQRLIEGTLPTIARELTTLNKNLARIAEAFERSSTVSPDDDIVDAALDAAFLRHARRRRTEIVSENEGREL